MNRETESHSSSNSWGQTCAENRKGEGQVSESDKWAGPWGETATEGGQDMKQLAKQVEGIGFKFILIINCQLVQTAIQKWTQNDYEINAEHTIKK